MQRRRRVGRSVAVVATAAAVLAAVVVSVPTAVGQESPEPESFCAGVEASDPFVDVADDDTAIDTIRCLVAAELTSGTTATTYEPASGVTRRQMALFVARLVERAAEFSSGELAALPPAGSAGFSDVGGERPEVVVAADQLTAAGIVDGRLDGTYGPAEEVTREQMAKFVALALAHLTGEDLPEGTDAFGDDDTSVFEAFIDQLVAAGIVQGGADGEFDPGASVTRRQMATFLIGALAHLHDDGLVTALIPEVAAFEANGSVEQIWVVGAEPGAELDVVGPGGEVLAEGTVDENGSYLFHELVPGEGYTVRQAGDAGTTEQGPIEVLSTASAPPDPSIYGQDLEIDPETNTGYGYLTTRDGTELAYHVRLPGPVEEGPYPTVVEYSGYDPANPAEPEPITLISGLLGYATVGVNMRGTGCSGGVFDYFEPLQSLDGYDVIETVATQPWVAHDHVGMVGISYSGISQLFTAATQPPSLAAIAPLSVIDDTATTLYPGGILNNGFALSWGQERVDESMVGGQPWAAERLAAGDEDCIDNQRLRAQTPDLLQKISDNRFYVPEVADPLAPATFVDQIEVPTYLACQWQDEQTGGHCPAMIDNFTGTDDFWATLTNGTHTDSLAPATFVRWFDFLELYVAEERPTPPASLDVLAPAIYQTLTGIEGVTLPDDPIQDEPDYASALAAFEALPRVRVLFDNGAGAEPGLPVPGFEEGFDAYPLDAVTPEAWYLGPDATLGGEPPAADGADAYEPDPSARPVTNFDGETEDIWVATPDYDWQPVADGHGVVYESAPLDEDRVVVGAGSVDLWLRSTGADTDLQVTLTEILPDGTERFVQNGWLRASMRALDADESTELVPVQTLAEADTAPLPAGEWAEARVALYPFGHAFREGSSLRLTVQAPGGDQPFWAFDTLTPEAGQEVSVAHGTARPSRVVLPVVDGVDVPTPTPPCPSLRGQPCRDAVPITNDP